jgi:CubicO group peptidase (beta-lactamase class C family)
MPLSCLLVALIAVPPTTKEIDAILESGRDAWHIPGMAAVVVHDGKIVYLKGLGSKRLGDPEPVTPDTVFPLASCTKPFTALALARLVDDGTIGWDDRVHKHLPDLHLKDRCADERMTLRDLLCHRTGMGRHDPLWYRSPWTASERLSKLVFLDPASDFRTRFEYQPVLFGAAGLAGAKAAKLSWRELMERRVLGPLGMTSSTAWNPPDAAKLTGFHRRAADGAIVPTPRYVWKEPDPAGSLHSTARDLAAFLRAELGAGVGRKFVSTATLEEMHRPQMTVPRVGIAKDLNPESTQIAYGLGWAVQDYRGRLMMLHGGAIDGARVQMTLVPEIGLGIALLSNLEGHFGNMAMSNRIVDRFLGVPKEAERDWQRLFLKIEHEEIENVRERGRKLRADQRPGSTPQLPLSAYAGEYVDPAYGTCRIRSADGRLTLAWGDLASSLEFVAGDRFLATDPPCYDAGVDFRVENGSVVAVRVMEREFVRQKPRDKRR